MTEKTATLERAFSISELIEAGYGSRTLLYKEINKGNLRSRKIGGKRTVILARDLEEYLARSAEVGRKSA